MQALEPRSPRPGAGSEYASPSGLGQSAIGGQSRAPLVQASADDGDDPTSVYQAITDDRIVLPEPKAVRGMYARVLQRLDDAVLSAILSAIFAGVIEAAQLQHAGLGASGTLEAARFVAAAGLLTVPMGAFLGVGVFIFVRLVPPERLAALRFRPAAPLVYAAGVVLPLLLACLFQLYLFADTRFQSPPFAALALAFLSVGAFGGGLGVGRLVAAGARFAGRWRPVLERGRVAIACVLAVWAIIALPSLRAGPDDAQNGPFGFIGVLREDGLDYRPLVTCAALVMAFLAAVPLVSRLTRAFKIVLCAALALCAPIGIVRAGDDSMRPLVLERGFFTRGSLRALQRLGDWDGDGFSRWLGGGDCNDSDRQIHPGARDIPDNGIDEDCDGEDLHAPKEKRAPMASPRIAPERFAPNLSFLLITVDALRPDLGFMGYGRNVSPQIDKLAAQSVVYEHAYAISTYTGYCLPPMMASRYPSEMPRTNRHEVRYFAQNVLLAERMKQAGFRTVGAASHFLFRPELGWTAGFDRFLAVASEGDAPPGSHVNRFYSSRNLADATISMLKEPHVTQDRFFMWVHFLDPHNEYLKHPGFSRFGGTPRDLYDGEVAFTDFHIGRVIEALDASPLAGRTVVVLTGDHGEAFGEHGAYFHGRELWDEIVRVPLLMRVPGAKPRRISTRVSLVDLAPTVLELAGAAADPGARGQSLAPELFGLDLPERPILIDQPHNQYYPAKRAFIEDGMKLHHLFDSNTYRLFDLEHDPHETHDLASEDPASLRRIRRDYTELASQLVEVDSVSPEAAASYE